jgi:hypothetical protein
MPFLPDVILLGQIPLATVAVTGLVGALLAYWLASRRDSAAADLVLNLMIGGVVGAKLIYVLLDFRSYLANPGTLILFPYGPLALPAGIVGGLAAVALGLWRRTDLLHLLDLAAAPLALGLAVALAGWQAPGSWAFAPTVAVAGGVALALKPGAAWPGQRAAHTVLLVAGALALADQARPAVHTTALQAGAAVIGTAAWLWLRRNAQAR